jgi:energy-coupling factor transporter ATP-binding protein EcfA2
MIRHLTIDGFKTLVKMELELGRMNVFVGANGSGKSNLLEAVGILGSAAFGRVDDETLLRRGVRPGVPSLYKTAFPSIKVPRLRFQAVSDAGASYGVSLWNPIPHPDRTWSDYAWWFMSERLVGSKQNVIVSREENSSELYNPSQGLAALKTVELPPGAPALRLMNQLRSYGIHSPNTPSLRGLTQDLQSREPVGLAGGRLPEAVDELLATARKKPELAEALEEVRELLDWAADFSAAPSVEVRLSPSAARSRLVIQFVDRFMAKGRNTLTGYDASEGALYILYFAVMALHPKAPPCLAVDNVDQALNPRLAQKLIAAICSWTKHINGGRQWLVTAHNPAILDGLPLDDPEIRLFTVDRDSNGHTVLKRIDLAEAIKLRPNEDWTLSRMWLNGLLGGVPNV